MKRILYDTGPHTKSGVGVGGDQFVYNLFAFSSFSWWKIGWLLYIV